MTFMASIPVSQVPLVRPLRESLSLLDFFVLVLIFFGSATVTSLAEYFSLQQAGQAMPESLDFDSDANWKSIGTELLSLAVAALWLRFRRFDFRALNLRIDRWTLPLAVALFVVAGLAADAWQFVHFQLWPEHYSVPEAVEAAAAWSGEGAAAAASAAPASADGGALTAASTLDSIAAQGHEAVGASVSGALTDGIPGNLAESTAGAMGHGALSVSLVLFALLNGFFEEVFFLGLVLAVSPRWRPLAIVLSLGVRFAFHTYQGLAGAATITTLGLVFLLARRRISALPPFMLAHACFDVTGLGLIHLFGG